MPPTTETKPKKQPSPEHQAATLAQVLTKFDNKITRLTADTEAAKTERANLVRGWERADPKVLAMAEAIRGASNGDAKATGKAEKG